jgi:hypothetical protein
MWQWWDPRVGKENMKLGQNVFHGSKYFYSTPNNLI